MTRDKRLVVFHDDILDNASTGTGLISQLDYDQISGVRTKARDGADIEGQPIEAFEDVLGYCRDLGLGLIVEIKDRLEGTAHLENVVRLLEHTDMFGRALISSFDHVVLRAIKSVAPQARTMGINYHRLADPAAAARSANMDMMNTDYPQFAPDVADGLHRAGVGVSHYLPRPEYFALRRKYGADYHDELRAYLRAGLIDMLVCDDVAWTKECVTDCGLAVVGLNSGD